MAMFELFIAVRQLHSIKKDIPKELVICRNYDAHLTSNKNNTS